MPPFWTSTSLSSLGRQLLAAAKHVPRTSLRRIPNAVVQAVRETFPTLTESTHHTYVRSTLVLQPIRLGTNAHRPQSAHARLMASSRNFRTGSGGRVRVKGNVSNVGLGSARTFASGPTSSAVQSNVPVVLRAFASLLSDEETNKVLPRATRFTPYTPRRGTRRNRRAIRTCSVDSRISLSDFTHYFPYSSPITITLPPTAETLITPGSTTILSLPLSPSISALLSSTTHVPYAAAEVGVAVFSSLTMGVLSLQEAFSLHYWHRIGPLLARLDDLGFLGGGGKGVRHEMVFDQGRPEILRFSFENRSEEDIMALLGEWLVEEDGRVWWGLTEVTEVGGEKGGMELTKRESKEMMEVWDETTVAQIPDVEVIYPSLDASVFPSDSNETDLWASGQSSPISVYTPISDLDSDLEISSYLSSPDPQFIAQSLTASLLSQLSSVSSMDNQRWSVQPSEDDLEVESAESVGMISGGSEVWSEMEEVDDMFMVGSWPGVGQGFGMSQSW